MNCRKLMVDLMRQSAKASNLAMRARDKSYLIDHDAVVLHRTGNLTTKRAKIACSGCDKLLAPDWPNRIKSGVYCSPECLARLKRWPRFQA